MINWEIFKNNLKTFLSNHIAKNEKQLAEFIADQYEIAVFQGNDMFWKNNVVIYNKKSFSKNIENAFTLAKKTNNTNSFNSLFMLAVISFWTNAKLALVIPPITSISVVSNDIIFPGSVQSFNISPSEDSNIFVNKIVAFFKAHLLTLSGITVGLVPQPSGPPIPIPFNWTGYQ